MVVGHHKFIVKRVVNNDIWYLDSQGNFVVEYPKARLWSTYFYASEGLFNSFKKHVNHKVSEHVLDMWFNGGEFYIEELTLIPIDSTKASYKNKPE